MSLHNADGSRAELSGNGLRCLVAAAVAHGLVPEGTLDVATDAGARRVTVALDPSSGRAWGSVDMGAVQVSDGGSLERGVAAHLGNPHVVIADDGRPAEDLLERAAGLVGAATSGANVEFVTLDGPDHLTIRVVERGVGRTLACGTGSCAAAAVAHRLGLVSDARDGDEPRRRPRRDAPRRHRDARGPRRARGVGLDHGAVVTVYPSSLIERTVRERIVLVGVALAGRDAEDVDAGLDELALLVDTAGADVLARLVQRRDAPDPATYLGKGKVAELHELCLAVDADTVVFDPSLTPAQQRNLERLLGRTAIDRTAVILDIFAQNARSPEGKAQVELALLRYRLPRLRGRGVDAQPAGRPHRHAWPRRDPARGRPPAPRAAHAQARGRAARTSTGRARPSAALASAGATARSPSSGTRTPARPRCSTRSPRPTPPWRTGSSSPSTPARASTSCRAARRSSSPTRSGSSATCRTSSSRRSAPRSTRCASPTCSSTWSTPRPRIPLAQIDAVRSRARRDRRGGRRRGARDQQGRTSHRSRPRAAPARNPGAVVGLGRDRGEPRRAAWRSSSDRLRASDRVVSLRVPWARGDVLAAAHREGEVLETSDDGESAVRAGRPRPRGPGAVRRVGLRLVSSARVRPAALPLRPARRAARARRAPRGRRGRLLDRHAVRPARARRCWPRSRPRGPSAGTRRRAARPRTAPRRPSMLARRFEVDVEPDRPRRVRGHEGARRPPSPGTSRCATPRATPCSTRRSRTRPTRCPRSSRGCARSPCALDGGRLALERLDEATARARPRAVGELAVEPHRPARRPRPAAAFGRRHGVVVCSDECYADYTWLGAPSTVLAHGPEGVLAVHSLSKRSNLAGVRAGFYAGDPALVAYLALVRRHAGLIVAGPVQAAAAVAVERRRPRRGAARALRATARPSARRPPRRWAHRGGARGLLLPVGVEGRRGRRVAARSGARRARRAHREPRRPLRRRVACSTSVSRSCSPTSGSSSRARGSSAS